MSKRRNSISEQENARVLTLLREADLTLVEIAQRLGLSRGAVQKINAREKIRFYNGKRKHWEEGLNK